VKIFTGADKLRSNGREAAILSTIMVDDFTATDIRQRPNLRSTSDQFLAQHIVTNNTHLTVFYVNWHILRSYQECFSPTTGVLNLKLAIS